MGGKRYNDEPKLNIKKVIGVIIGIAVVIMFIVALTKLLSDSQEKVISTEKTSYFSVYTNEKWGVIDNNGNIVIEPSYDEMVLVPFIQSPIFICTYDVDYENNTYKTKAINEKGEEILKGYDNISAISNKSSDGKTWFESNVFKVQKDGKYGLINEKGSEIIPCNYDEISALQGVKNCILIMQNNKYGICNQYGNIILNTEYKSIKSLGDSISKEFIVQNDEDKYGIMSADNTVVLEPKYNEISNVSANNLYVVKEDDKWKVINKDESVNLTEGFSEVKEINGTNIIVQNKDKYGLIDTEGKTIIELKYDGLNFTYGNNLIAKQGDKYGIISLSDEEKVPFDYENITNKKGTNFFIGDKGKTDSDFINENYEVKLSGILSDINIEEAYMKVYTNGEYKYYNFKFEEKKNTELLKKNTLFLDKKDGKYGYINNRGEVVVDYQYDDATEQNQYGYASVNKDGKWGSIDKDGKIVAEPSSELKNNEVIDFIGKWHLGADATANYYTDI